MVCSVGGPYAPCSVLVSSLFRNEEWLVSMQVFFADSVVVVQVHVRCEEVQRRSERLPYVQHIDNCASRWVVSRLPPSAYYHWNGLVRIVVGIVLPNVGEQWQRVSSLSRSCDQLDVKRKMVRHKQLVGSSVFTERLWPGFLALQVHFLSN